MATLAAVASAVAQGQSTFTTACRFATDSPLSFLLTDDLNYLTAEDGTRLLIGSNISPMRGMCVAGAALSTATQFATDVAAAVYLTTDGGDHLTTDDGFSLLLSSPQRGLCYASASMLTLTSVFAVGYGQGSVRAAMLTLSATTAAGYGMCSNASAMLATTRFAANANALNANAAALQSAIQLAAQAQGFGSATSGINAATLLAAAPNGIGSASASAATGIVLGATVTGIAYASVALGGGTSLAITAAGLASITGALFTQMTLAATPSGFGSAAAQFATGNQMAAVANAFANAQGGLTASIVIGAQALGLTQVTPALSTSITVQGAPAGFASAQAVLATGLQLSVSAAAAVNAQGTLTTAEAAYGAVSRAIVSASAALNGNVNLVTAGSSNFVVTARLLTVLQPPGEFADIRWLRVPRGGDEPYAEFFQMVGEQLWYGVNWEDWLASTWEANSTATVGQAIRPTIANGLEFVCITGGQTGAVEPNWATFAGGQTVDGTALWQAQAISAVSLDDTITGSSFSAPLGITLDSAQIQSLRSYLIIETQAAVAGTDYDVLCTVYTEGGQQKIAKLRIKVR